MPMHGASRTRRGRGPRGPGATITGSVIAILCFTSGPGPSGAGPAPAAPVVIEAPERYGHLAGRLRRSLPASLSAAMTVTGVDRLDEPIRVYLVGEDSGEAREAPSWSSAYAVGPAGVIVILPDRVPSYPYDSLESVLAHELTHVLAARRAGGQPLPRWFEEGLAMAAGRPWGVEDRARLVMAMLGTETVTRAQLDALFTRDAASARRAYVLSAALVRAMLTEWGPRVAADVLELVGRGMPFPDAFQRVTAVDLDRFEAAFWGDQRWWNRWVPILTSSTILWAAITLLLLYAYHRRRRQVLAIQRRWRLEGDDGE